MGPLCEYKYKNNMERLFAGQGCVHYREMIENCLAI